MATQKTDFSLSVNVNPDTSKVQKTLNQRTFRINTQVDIDTRMVQNRINSLFQNSNLQGFDKINTTIQRNLTGLDQFGNRVTGLIKYTETFKNAIGDVNERVTLLTRNGRIIGQSLNTIQRGIAEVTTNTRQFNTTVNGMNTSITEVTKTTRDTGGNIRTVVERTSEWVDANNRLNRTVETLDENNRQLAPTIRTIGENTREVGNNAQEASNQISLLDRALAGLWNALGAEVIQLFHKALRETITTIKEFDSALIEFRKVSDLSGQSLTNYVAKLAEMGELTGSTMQAMVEAATEFRKSSFSDEDSAKLASVAEMYRNIADEEISAGEAASFIISQMKAFNINADEAMHIIDAVNQTSNKFAVSSADIATNLNKMSSVMAVNNVTFEEQIGLLVGVTELTRNASSATRGLTMIASRLTQVLDDSSSTGKKLTAIYEGLGIKLKDENGQLRSTTAILKDLSEKWDSLSDNEQKYISLTSAGARQQNVFTSLMKNFNTVIKATEEAYNSTGSAARENAKVMDSVAKKVEILKSEFQQIVIGKGGLQELSKGFLDIGISALKLIDSIGGLTPLFVTLAGVIVTMKADSIVEGFANFNRTCLNLTQTLSTMLPLFREGRASGMSFGDALRYAGITASTAQLALGALTTVISIAVIAFKKYQQQQEESHRKAVETLKDYENYSNSLSETLEKIKDENTSKEELIKINKNLNDSYDDEKAQLKDIKDLREENIELLYKEAQEKARATVRETASETEKAKSYLGSKVKGTDLGGFNIDRNTLLDTMEYTSIMTSTIGKSRAEQLKIIENELDKYSEKISKNIELSKSESLTLQQLNITYDILKEKYDTAINSVNTYKQAQEVLNQSEQEFISTLRTKANEQGISTELTIEEQNKLIEQYRLTEEAIQEVLDAEEDMTRSEAIQYLVEQADASNVLSEASKELSKHIEDCAKSLGITATELAGLRERFDDLTLDNFLSRLAELRQTIDDTNTVIDNLQSALETASGALEEYNENGYLTIDTFQSLVSISAQYLAALVNENGQLEINQQTLGNLVDTLKIAKIEELAEAAATEIAALQHQESATSADAAQRAVDAAGDAFIRAGDKASKASAGIALFNAELKKATGGNLGDFSGSEKVIIDKYRKLAKEISTLSVNTTKAGNAASSAGKKGAGAAKEAKDATKELNKELEETKKKYDTVIKWISKQYDKEIDSIKKAEKEALKAEEAKIKAKEKEKDNALDAIEKEIKVLEKAKDARKKYWDDQIDALKKANDARKDALELQEKLDALEKAKATKVKIYKEGQGFVYDVDQTAVAKAQKELDEYLSEKAYEDELARLEALRDAEMDNYEQRINAMNEYKDNVQANYEAQIEAMNEYKEQLEAQYEAEIEIYENYKQQFEDMVNAYEEEQNRLLAQQLTGIDFENKNWMTRLDNLATFVNEYNKLQKQLDTGNTSVSNTASMKSSGGNVGGGSKTTATTSSYDREMALSHQGYHGMPTNVVTGTRATSGLNQYIPTTEKTNVSSNGVIKKHAKGVGSVKQDELAIVGENPNQEIVIGSKINNGELMNLGKGTGVVNADSSKTLAGMLNQVGQFGASGFGSGNGTLNNNINNDSLVINGVTVQGANIKDPETFVNGLLNLKAEALQRAYRHR